MRKTFAFFAVGPWLALKPMNDTRINSLSGKFSRHEDLLLFVGGKATNPVGWTMDHEK